MIQEIKKLLLELCNDAQIDAEQRLFGEIKDERNTARRLELVRTLDAMSRAFTALRSAVENVERF